MKGNKLLIFKLNAFIIAFFAILAFFVVLTTVCIEDTNIAYADDFAFETGYKKSITKNYDGHTENVFVNVDYDGEVTYTWYKDGVIVESEQNLSVKYPYHSGNYYCVAEADGMTARTDNIRITIYKSGLRVNIDNKEVLYGEEEVPLTYGVVGLYQGDNEEDLNISLSRRPGRNAGEYLITGTGESDIYNFTFVTGVYTIKQRNIYVAISSLESEYGDPLKQFSYVVEEGDFAPEEGVNDLYISLSKEDGSGAGRYAITGQYENQNYNVIFRSATYTIKPKKVEGYLSGVVDLVYNGKQPDIKCELLGVGAELGLTTTISFDRVVCDAGEYVAYARITNRNYQLLNDGIYYFTVKKAPLLIKLENISYVDKDVTPKFVYVGFAEGETEQNLKTLPKVDLPEEVGEYNLLPYGAESDNYEFSYATGKVTVYRNMLETEDGTLEGKFLPSAKLELIPTSEYNGFKPNGTVIYAVEINTNNGAMEDYYGHIGGVGNTLPVFVRACIVDSDGVKHQLDGFTVKDGVIDFKSNTDGVLIIYYDFTLLIVGGAILLLIAFIIIIKVASDKQKYQKTSALRAIAEREVADAYKNLD